MEILPARVIFDEQPIYHPLQVRIGESGRFSFALRLPSFAQFTPAALASIKG